MFDKEPQHIPVETLGGIELGLHRESRGQGIPPLISAGLDVVPMSCGCSAFTGFRELLRSGDLLIRKCADCIRIVHNLWVWFQL